MRTTTHGTDWIGQFPGVLDKHLPGSGYQVVELPDDPPSAAKRDALWTQITGWINAGYGMVANIVAPPGTYPRGTYTSTFSPANSGETFYHYIEVTGYAVDAAGGRHAWIADSEFTRYGYWCSHNQLATLMPPKGYACPAGAIAVNVSEGLFMSLLRGAPGRPGQKNRRDPLELIHRFKSRFHGPSSEGKPSHTETLLGYILEVDKKIEEMNSLRLPALQKALYAAAGLFGMRRSS